MHPDDLAWGTCVAQLQIPFWFIIIDSFDSTGCKSRSVCIRQQKKKGFKNIPSDSFLIFILTLRHKLVAILRPTERKTRKTRLSSRQQNYFAWKTSPKRPTQLRNFIFFFSRRPTARDRRESGRNAGGVNINPPLWWCAYNQQEQAIHIWNAVHCADSKTNEPVSINFKPRDLVISTLIFTSTTTTTAFYMKKI